MSERRLFHKSLMVKEAEPTNHRDRMDGSETHDQKGWNDKVQRLVLDVRLLYSARDRVELDSH